MRSAAGFIFTLLLLIPICFGQRSILDQVDQARFYTAYYKFTPSESAAVLTVQQPAGASFNLQFVGAYVYCSVACEITLERNGTAASTTSFTPSPVNPNGYAATAVAYRDSNVGTGTVIAKYVLAAGTDKTIDLSGTRCKFGSGVENLTLRSASVTGEVRMLVQWGEL